MDKNIISLAKKLEERGLSFVGEGRYSAYTFGDDSYDHRRTLHVGKYYNQATYKLENDIRTYPPVMVDHRQTIMGDILSEDISFHQDTAITVRSWMEAIYKDSHKSIVMVILGMIGLC